MTTDTATDPALVLHRWLSPAYPVGSFAYSHGIEAAVAEGRISDAVTTQAWLIDVLSHGAGRNDAILLAAAYRAHADKLPEIAELALAMAPSAGRRLETQAQGAAFAATTSAVHGITLPAMPYPVAVGRAARLMDLPLALTLRLSVLAFAAALVSAATRLVPLGQTEAQTLLARIEPEAARIADDAAPGDLDALGSSALWSDIAAMRQEVLPTRLFRS